MYKFKDIKVFTSLLKLFSSAESVTLTFDTCSITVSGMLLDQIAGVMFKLTSCEHGLLLPTENTHDRHQMSFDVKSFIGALTRLGTYRGAVEFEVHIRDTSVEFTGLNTSGQVITTSTIRATTLPLGTCEEDMFSAHGLQVQDATNPYQLQYDISLDIPFQLVLNGLSVSTTKADVTIELRHTAAASTTGLCFRSNDTLSTGEVYVILPSAVGDLLGSTHFSATFIPPLVTMFKSAVRCMTAAAAAHKALDSPVHTKKRKKPTESEEEDECGTVLMRAHDGLPLGLIYQAEGCMIAVYGASKLPDHVV
jgi:hypothetical protein